MFIRIIYRLFVVPVSNSRSQFNYQARFGELQTKVRDYEKKLNILSPVDLSIIKFHKSACAKYGSGRSVNLPSWYLFKPEDIPPRFRITDLNDRRLVSPAFLDEFAGWMNEKIAEMGLTTVCRSVDRGTLQRVVYLLRDPALYEKAKDFVIGHEMAHLAHFQGRGLERIYQKLSIVGVMVGIFSLILVVSIAPVVHLTITLCTAGIAIAITGGSALAWFNRAGSVDVSAVEEEKAADLDSAKMLKDASGGIYYFQSTADRQQAVRRSNPLAHTNIDERGNNLKDIEHPPLTERVAYLRQWQAEHRD